MTTNHLTKEEKLMNLRKTLFLLPAATLVLVASSLVSAATTCTFTTVKKTMTLNADCTTDSSILVPNGFTLNGAGHTITAVDPVAGHFVGGVIQNGGASANVTNSKITASGLADVCDAGANRLRGILFDGASGSITNNQITNINQNQGAVLSGCQEGNAIEVRNFGASPSTVRAAIVGNTVSGYQKTGIIANGDTDATISDNTVTGTGPNLFIAQNGVQIGFGASGMVTGNNVSGNSYVGPFASFTSSAGILIFGEGPDELCVNVQVMKNTLTGNDVGIFAAQFDDANDAAPPSSMTNLKLDHNTIDKGNAGNPFYTAGVSDEGNNDKIINNTITGYALAVDADPSFTNRAKVHANK
jgi:parallel beta helix pectate lyase-like protein